MFSTSDLKDEWVKNCKAWASAYYNAVRLGGGAGYKKRQTGACECQDCFGLEHGFAPPPMACVDENGNPYPLDQCPPSKVH